MLHSYRLRLFIGLLLVALLSILLVTLLTSRGIGASFLNYVSLSEQEERQAIARVIEYQVKQGGLEHIGPFADVVGHEFGQPITLTDEQGQILFSAQEVEALEGTIIVETVSTTEDTARALALSLNTNAQVTIVEEMVTIESIAGAGIVPGGVWGSPADLAGVVPGRIQALSGEAVFLGQTNWLLLITAVVALLLAGVASVWLSRSFMRPVTALTGAAEKMAQGDLSQRVDVERPDELGRLAQSFNTMAGNLEEQERLRRAMVTDIAHELRTPLSNVQGYLEAIQDGVVRPDEVTIDSLHEETLLLGRLVADLQDLSLAEGGQLHLKIEPVLVDELLDAAARAVLPVAKEKSITVTTETTGNLPPIAADRHRTNQVIRNLLGNAITYTPPDGRVSLSAAVEGEGVVIQVSDTGPGIDPEHLPYIFERFYRPDVARDRTTGGAGLGLAIAKAYVEQQGGRLSLQSDPGEGATFSVWLPMALAQT